MLKKLSKYDLIFIATMIMGLAVHLACIYGADHFADESFFPTVPLRLINGDSLVSDDWHVTQFTSLFLYLPVRVWLAIKGSTQGIILFLRYFYLVIHTSVSVGIYGFFRKHKLWSVAAALMFYTQVPLRFLSANYHSLLALFLLLLTLTLLSLCKNKNTYLYILAGFFFGCCCVCNPIECVVLGVYIIACIVWRIQKKSYKKKYTSLSYEEAFAITQKSEIRNRFFSSKAFFKFLAGISVAAVISIVFYFATGGTIPDLFRNIPYLLQDEGHNIFEFAEKLSQTLQHFNTISFKLPFLLPVFYIILLVDKKRKAPRHKLCYVIGSLILAVFYTIGVLVGSLGNSRCLAMSLPFIIISTVCYILTENKNKKLFYCMWIPAMIANIAQYWASALHLSTMWVMTIANIAGVFFVMDFISEIKPVDKETVNLRKACQGILCVGICLQLVFQCSIYLIGRTVKVTEYKELERGPYAGLLLEEDNYNKNNAIMNDLDVIKARSNPDDPVWIVTEFSWMYLYLERPFAVYSAWQPYLELSRMLNYYNENPEKKAKYIYICWVYIPTGVSTGHVINQTRARNNADTVMENIDCEYEELSYGILLTVKE